MESDLRNAQKKIAEIERMLKEAIESNEMMKKQVEGFKESNDELQNHVFVLNNRINELEDQKKVLMDQLHAAGEHSRAHYTHRKLKKDE